MFFNPAVPTISGDGGVRMDNKIVYGLYKFNLQEGVSKKDAYWNALVSVIEMIKDKESDRACKLQKQLARFAEKTGNYREAAYAYKKAHILEKALEMYENAECARKRDPRPFYWDKYGHSSSLMTDNIICLYEEMNLSKDEVKKRRKILAVKLEKHGIHDEALYILDKIGESPSCKQLMLAAEVKLYWGDFLEKDDCLQDAINWNLSAIRLYERCKEEEYSFVENVSKLKIKISELYERIERKKLYREYQDLLEKWEEYGNVKSYDLPRMIELASKFEDYDTLENLKKL